MQRTSRDQNYDMKQWGTMLEEDGRAYTVIHLLVVDDSCVLVWDHAHWLGAKQNTRNIYHKQMNNSVM